MPISMQGSPYVTPQQPRYAPGVAQSVPVVASRARAATDAMHFDAASGGWVTKPSASWASQTSQLGSAVRTRWTPGDAASNLNLRGATQGDHLMARKAAMRSQAPATTNAPPGTYAGVAAQPAPPSKFASGITVMPWAPPRPDYADTPASPPKRYTAELAPGTRVPMRGGWPIERSAE